MIKAIIFDCFGVLTADLWQEFAASLSENQKVPARELRHQVDCGQINPSEFANQVEVLTGHRPTMFEIDHDQPKNNKLLLYIAELKKHYKIGVLSNSSSRWVQDHFLSSEENQLFDSFTLSFEVGTIKPDRRIYLSALESLGIEPAESIYVDDIDRFTQAASKIGMQTVLYKNFDQMKHQIETILANQR